MSEKTEKPMGLPPYYWAKAPVKQKPVPRAFMNKQQKQFYVIRIGFMVAKIAAAAALLLLIVTRF